MTCPAVLCRSWRVPSGVFGLDDGANDNPPILVGDRDCSDGRADVAEQGGLCRETEEHVFRIVSGSLIRPVIQRGSGPSPSPSPACGLVTRSSRSAFASRVAQAELGGGTSGQRE
jgi:hypothetical protein